MKAIGFRGCVVAVALSLLCAAAWCEPRVTMELKDMSVSEAVRALFTKAGERCVVDGEVTGMITAISLKDVPLQSALRAVLRGSNSTFEVRNGAYFIKPKPADPLKPAVAPPPPKQDPPAPPPPVAVKKPAPVPDQPVNRVKMVTRQAPVVRPAQAPIAQRNWNSRPPVRSSAALRRGVNHSPVRFVRPHSSIRAPRVYTRTRSCGTYG